MKLEDIASVIRSKNAGRGPSLSTLCSPTTPAMPGRRSRRRSPRRASPRCMAWPRASAGHPPSVRPPINIVMPRRVTAGDPGDTDAYGAQQHGPLLGIEL